MFLNNWKKAAKISLVLCVLSLPVWALHHGGGDRHHGGGDDGGCGGGDRDRHCGGGGGGQNVPEGGNLLAYTGLSGAMIAGGLALARKSRSL